MFYLTIFILCQFSGKLTGTLSGFITRVKPAPFGLLCAWREVHILRQQVPIPEADRSVLASDVVARVPSTQWLKKEEAKTKLCSRLTPLPTLQPMLQPTQRLML
jgi:hypothetical protein